MIYFADIGGVLPILARMLAEAGRSVGGLMASRIAVPVAPKGGAPGRTFSPAKPSIAPGLFLVLVRATDLATLLIAGAVADLTSRGLGTWLGLAGAADDRVLANIVAACAALFVLGRSGISAQDMLGVRCRLRTALFAAQVGALAGVFCSAAVAGASLALGIWALAWAAVAGMLTAAGVAASAYLLRSLPGADRLVPRIAVVGRNAFSRAFIERVVADPVQTVTFVGLYDDGWEPHAAADIPVLGQIENLVARARQERIDAVVLATPLANKARVAQFLTAVSSMTADVLLATEVLELISTTSRIDRLGPNPVVKIASRPLTDWQMLQKAVFDFVLAAAIFVLVLPLMLLCGLAVRLDSPGPALFRQRRRGYNTNTFNMFKFRTMYTHLSDANADRQTVRDDPRMTFVGRFLRRTSIDELPQLLNVLRGEMSLVGPRPHAIGTKAGDQLFPDAVADYTRRYRVKPGITGWAQINGCRGETRTLEQIERRVAHDLYYIDNWSLALDLKIIGITVLHELRSNAAF